MDDPLNSHSSLQYDQLAFGNAAHREITLAETAPLEDTQEEIIIQEQPDSYETSISESGDLQGSVLSINDNILDSSSSIIGIKCDRLDNPSYLSIPVSDLDTKPCTSEIVVKTEANDTSPEAKWKESITLSETSSIDACIKDDVDGVIFSVNEMSEGQHDSEAGIVLLTMPDGEMLRVLVPDVGNQQDADSLSLLPSSVPDVIATETVITTHEPQLPQVYLKPDVTIAVADSTGGGHGYGILDGTDAIVVNQQFEKDDLMPLLQVSAVDLKGTPSGIQFETAIRESAKRESDKQKKRELRKNPVFREIERQKSRERMKKRRTDPAYREQEREKDRIRRQAARQTNPEMREMEKQRDRLYKKVYRTLSKKSKTGSLGLDPVSEDDFYVIETVEIGGKEESGS